MGLALWVAPADPLDAMRALALGADDRELMRLSQRSEDWQFDTGRWQGLALLFGR